MKKTKSSLIVINSRFFTQQITGVQRFAIEISKGLKKRLGDDVKFVSPKNITHESLASELNLSIVGKNTGHLWEQYDLPKFLKAINKPLLLNLANTAPLCYENKIVTIHDLAFLENPKWFSKTFYHFYHFLIPRIVRNSKQILTVSNFSKSEIVKKIKIKEDKIKVIYNSINVDILPSKGYNSPYGKYALFVGSLDPRKNIMKLFEAVRFFHSDIKLLIVGGMNKSFNSFKVNKNENIIFTGYVTDKELGKLYSNAVCFVYPSLYEGFGIPPLEAQYLGVPVVLSDIPVFKEVFSDSVFYCNPNSPESIAQAINKISSLSALERENVVIKGYENAQKYTWEEAANKVLEIINNLE